MESDFGANQARIFSVLMLYNAVKILEMKYEGRMEKLEEKMLLQKESKKKIAQFIRRL